MANPFAIEPANPLQALMMGVQGFDTAAKRTKEQQLQEGRQQITSMLAGGAKPADVFGQLLGLGDVQGATALGQYLNTEASRKHSEAALAETMRHNKSVEGLTAQQRDIQANQPVKLGEDPIRGSIYGVRDPKSPTGWRRIELGDTGAALPGVPSAAPGVPGATPAPQGLPGDDASIPSSAAPVQAEIGRDLEYLRSVEQKYGPEVAKTVKNLADYNISPTSLSTRGGHREFYLGLASRYDPTFDQTQYPVKQQALVRFTSGPQGNTARAFNVSIAHLDTLQKLYDAIDNGNIQLFNSLKNKFRSQFGYEAPANLDAARQIIGAEVVKAIVGAQNAAGERGEARETISAKLSPGQAAGTIKTYKELFAGQMRGLEQQYSGATGKKDFRTRFLLPETRSLLEDADKQRDGSKSGTTSGGIKWKVID